MPLLRLFRSAGPLFTVHGRSTTGPNRVLTIPSLISQSLCSNLFFQRRQAYSSRPIRSPVNRPQLSKVHGVWGRRLSPVRYHLTTMSLTHGPGGLLTAILRPKSWKFSPTGNTGQRKCLSPGSVKTHQSSLMMRLQPLQSSVRYRKRTTVSRRMWNGASSVIPSISSSHGPLPQLPETLVLSRNRRATVRSSLKDREHHRVLPPGMLSW